MLALWRRPRLAPALGVPGVSIGAALLAYNVYFFNSVFGGVPRVRFRHRRLEPRGISRRGRGPAVFTWTRHIFLFSVRRRRAASNFAATLVVATRDCPAALAVSIVSSTALFSFSSDWQGGWSVGPRYLLRSASDPDSRRHRLAVALLPAQRRLGTLCFGILLPYSIFIQAVGSFSAEPLYWNADAEKDWAHSLWDFRHNPIARGLWSPPNAQGTPCATLSDCPQN